MQPMLAIAWKDLQLILRDRGALFWVLAFPLVMAILFGSIFGGSGDKIENPLALLVVDEAQSPASRGLIEQLSSSPSLALPCPDEAPDPPCNWTLAAAERVIQAGDALAYVRIGKGYSDDRFLPQVSALTIGIDPGRKMEKGVLKGLLMEATFGGLQKRFTDPSAMQTHLDRAIAAVEVTGPAAEGQGETLLDFLNSARRFYGEADQKVVTDGAGMGQPTFVEVLAGERDGPRSSYEISFPQALVWGLLGVLGVFAPLVARERVSGTLLRLVASPMPRWQILGGKALATFAGCIAVMVMLMVVGRLAFGVRIGDPVNLGLAMGAIGVCFAGMMMLIANFGKTEQAVSGAAWAVNMPLAIFGGGMVPLFMMPGWMVTGSYLSPIRHAVYALEGSIWRGLSLAELIQPCGILVGVGVVCFALGARMLPRAG